MIKIPKQEEPMPMNDPSMMGGEDPSMMGNQDPSMMGSEDPSMMDDMDDNGFDAGVEANEDEDPKKYIQQLSGKLSQELRNYNQEQENQDTELNKYVAGMVIPQTTKYMTDKDKEETIGKIKNGTVDDEPDENLDSDESMDDSNPMESRLNFGKLVNEIVNSFNDDKSNIKRKEKKLSKKNTNFNPFVSGI